MLMLTKEYRPGFDKFIAALKANKTSEQALTETYGKPLSKFDAEVQNYIRGASIAGSIVSLKLEKIAAPLTAEPLSPFEAKLRLADAASRPGNEKQIRQMVTELSTEQPTRPEPYVVQGYLEWHEGGPEARTKALKDFQKAYELGSRNSRMLWDYGRLAESRDRAEALKVLSVLLEEEPDRLDLRLEVARLQLVTQKPDAATITLNAIKHITPAEAPRVFRIKMLVAMAHQERDAAKENAELLAKYTTDEQEKAEAQRIIEWANSKPSTTPAYEAVPGTPGRPLLRRGSSQEPEIEIQANRLPSVTGTFLELKCADDKATVVLRTSDNQTRRFLIADPQKVIVNGAAGSRVDLTCGVQKPSTIRLEYTPPTGAGLDGLVRVLTFEQ